MEIAQILGRELLDRYTGDCEDWRSKAAEKARESYQSLTDAGVEIPVKRVELIARYMEWVLDAFPLVLISHR